MNHSTKPSHLIKISNCLLNFSVATKPHNPPGSAPEVNMHIAGGMSVPNQCGNYHCNSTTFQDIRTRIMMLTDRKLGQVDNVGIKLNALISFDLRLVVINTYIPT